MGSNSDKAWLYSLFLILCWHSQYTAALNYTSYLFTYFKGEKHQNGEAIYLAVSEPHDPSRWTELSQGAPILSSNVGTGGIRDPTIVRAHDGSKFWIIATEDLKMYSSGVSWDAAGRQGSRNIVIWESIDLVKWDGPRLARVSPPEVGNTWAPEAIWDPKLKEYHVYWASALFDKNDLQHRGYSYHRILKATTKDFVSFSPAEKYIDTGYATIDTTMVWDESSRKYFRFTKDERPYGTGSSRSRTGKLIVQEESGSIDGPWKVIKIAIGQGAMHAGEGPLVFQDIEQKSKVPNRTSIGIVVGLPRIGRGYIPFETTNIEHGQWKPSIGYNLPESSRHGSVIPITDEERNRLLEMK